jgi:heat shock protein HtpX
MGFAALTGQITGLLSMFGQIMLLISLPMIYSGEMIIDWLAIFLLIISPTLSSLIQLALSRTREYNADMGAAGLTGNPESLALALAKIDSFQKNRISRLIWPMIPRMPQALWLRTHPPTIDRIKRLLKVRDYDRLMFNYPNTSGRNTILDGRIYELHADRPIFSNM